MNRAVFGPGAPARPRRGRWPNATRRARKLPARPTAAAFRRIVEKLDRAARKLDGPEDAQTRRAWRWALDARVSRRALALRQAIDKAGSVYLAERLHASRIALKKLRYGLELDVESRGLKSTKRPPHAEADAGGARPAARSSGPHRPRPERAGVADAAERHDVARPRHGRDVARGELPPPARALRRASGDASSTSATGLARRSVRRDQPVSARPRAPGRTRCRPPTSCT